MVEGLAVKSIGDHGLGCLDDSDYGAVALAMQCNAVAINDALVATQASLAAYGNRFIRRFVSTSPSTSGANSGQLLPDGTAATNVMSANLSILPQGWYSAAASLSYQATGAVTVGSYRRSLIMVNSSIAVIPPGLFQSITVESNTGAADSTTVNGWFYSNGVQATTLQLMFGHGNTGSSMTVPVGAVMTIRFMSSGLVT
jgi:hypothetical protein